MPLKVNICLEKDKELNAVSADVIISGAFFGEKNIQLKPERGILSFVMEDDYCKEYMLYLMGRYDLSVDFI
jgi:hypothetical protein